MKALKKLSSFVVAVLLIVQALIIASAADENINLFIDSENKTMTVQGTLNKGDKFLIGMLLYNTNDYNNDNTVRPLTILDARTNEKGEFKFESIKFGEGEYLKMLTALIDTGDEIVKKETVVAFEDTNGSDSISGFSSAAALLTEEQIKNYYTVLVDFAGFGLVKEDGSYSSKTYEKLLEIEKEDELAKLLKSNVALCTTKEALQKAVKEHFAILAVKYLEAEDIYSALFEEVNVNVIDSNPSDKEKAVNAIKGNDYNSLSALENALNTQISTVQNGTSSNQGTSTVPSGSYTPIYTPSYSGGGSSGGGSSFGGGSSSGSVTPYVPAVPEKEEIKFTDISGHWSENDVKALASDKIINGYPDNSFKPDGNVTRAEAASIIKKAFSYADCENKNVFLDVSESDWYYNAINTLFEKGIMKGDGSTFKPNEYITREDLCVLIYRCLNNAEVNKDISFNDSKDISSYAVDAVGLLSEKSIIQGYENNFMPKAYVTRAQICAIINRTLKAVNN